MRITAIQCNNKNRSIRMSEEIKSHEAAANGMMKENHESHLSG
ncbi:24099_t:CDS:2 [Gigaspora margarita]|uniref:24099_t:CDS:1 n=1 Tax=Gigaspora margarita TaxID=4874 RepID=A0ABM8VY46_GIGMA|nr:24099_t:CDS:2 [Gigaspora margarita]